LEIYRCVYPSSKTECIEHAIELGYNIHNVLMVGDAVGDMEAASANGIFFYPIVPGKEEESWQKFIEDVLPLVYNHKYISEKYILKYKKVIGMN